MPKPLRIIDGRRFGCTMCGNCCEEDGYVFFSPQELEGMAKYLGLPIIEFRERFRVEWDSDSDCFAIEAKEGRGCPLLTDERKCSVHPAKPRQCATWPFWTEMLSSDAEWKRCKSYCPGLDAKQGRLYSAEEIAEICRERLDTDEASVPIRTS